MEKAATNNSFFPQIPAIPKEYYRYAAETVICVGSLLLAIQAVKMCPGLLLKIRPLEIIADKIVQIFPTLLIWYIKASIAVVLCFTGTICQLPIYEGLLRGISKGTCDLKLTRIAMSVIKLIFV